MVTAERLNLSISSRIERAVIRSGGMVCVGLDPDENMLPVPSVVDFNCSIVNATYDIAAAYKLQLAFYQSRGSTGIKEMESTISYIKSKAPDAVIIGDSKLCDVTHTAETYAKAFFDTWDFDAITAVPYTGEDGLKPYLSYPNKGVFVVCYTSNKSAFRFQDVIVSTPNGKSMPLYELIADFACNFSEQGNVGLVIGATASERLEYIGNKYPRIPLLIPGIGSQGGSIDIAAKVGYSNGVYRALVNSSRSIIYASAEPNKFEDAARKECLRIRNQINQRLAPKATLATLIE